MLLLLGKKVVLSGDGEKLDSMLSARSSKLQRASLFPIRGLSLSSRHWQHREKEEKQSIWDPFTFIILPGDFGDLPSFPLQAHAHTDTEAHISKCILLTWLRADGQHELIERNKVAEIKQTHSKMSVHVQTRTCKHARALMQTHISGALIRPKIVIHKAGLSFITPMQIWIKSVRTLLTHPHTPDRKTQPHLPCRAIKAATVPPEREICRQTNGKMEERRGGQDWGERGRLLKINQGRTGRGRECVLGGGGWGLGWWKT